MTANAPRYDYSGSLFATGFGLFWKTGRFTLVFGLIIAFIGAILTYWWFALTVAVFVVVALSTVAYVLLRRRR